MVLSLKIQQQDEKFLRLKLLDNTDIVDIYTIYSCSLVKRVFIVFVVDNVDTRYPLRDYTSVDDFIKNYGMWSIDENSIDSSNQLIYEASFVDIYSDVIHSILIDTLNNG